MSLRQPPVAALCAAVPLLMCTWCAHAAQLPPQVEPGREQRLPPTALPSAAASLDIGTSQYVGVAPANAVSIRFVLRELRVEGATVISSQELVIPYQARIGEEITVATLYDIAAQMTATYRQRGYLLSVATVPEQRIEEGRATIRIIEGKLDGVDVRGVAARRAGIGSALNRSLANRVTRSAPLERELLLVNDLPGMTARGTLATSDRGTGFAHLLVDTVQDHFVGSVAADNRGGRYLGNQRYTATAAINGLIDVADSTLLEYQTASPTERVRSWSIDHVERLTYSGLSLRLAYSRYDSEPDLGPGFELFNLETSSRSGRLELSYPWIRLRRTNLTTRLSYNYHDGKTDSSLLYGLTEDRLRIVRLGFTYDHTDHWRGVNTVDLELSRGLAAFGASKATQSNLSRPGGKPVGSKGTLYVARLQDLHAGFSLLLAATGQYAMSNLLAPEEFAFGGEFFGRSYDAAELVGDSGVAGKGELRFNGQIRALSLMPYAYYEAGWVSRRLGPNEIGREQESALSVGVGVRFGIGSYLTGYLEGGKPLNRDVAAEGNRKTRVFGGLRLTF